MLAYDAVGVSWMLYAITACGWLPICALLAAIPRTRATAKRRAGGFIGLAPAMALLQLLSLPIILILWLPLGGIGAAFRSQWSAHTLSRWVNPLEAAALAVLVAASLIGLRFGWIVGSRIGEGLPIDEALLASRLYRLWSRVLDFVDDRQNTRRRRFRIAALAAVLGLGVALSPLLLTYAWPPMYAYDDRIRFVDTFFYLPSISDISGRWATLSPVGEPPVVLLTLRPDGTGTLTAWFEGDQAATDYTIVRTFVTYTSFTVDFLEGAGYKRHPILVVGDILETALPVQIKTLRNHRVRHLLLWRTRVQPTFDGSDSRHSTY